MVRYYSSKEVVKRLGISRNTLYAYVSRGLIRSEPDSREKRARRYLAQDVDRLAKRSKIRTAPKETPKIVADGGGIILNSAITLFGDDTFYYRGRSVLTLAEQGSFEETIRVLWEPAGSQLGYPSAYVCDLVEETLRLLPKVQSPVENFLSLLSTLDARDVKTFAFTTEATAQAGVVMLDSLLRILTGDWRRKGVAEHLARYWGVEQANSRLLDSALTLVADHELDMPSFVARCTASASCSPYASVAAATHAFFGRQQEGITESVYGLLSEADDHNDLYEVIVSRVRRGDPVPGFGHRLHDIDPRADYLLHCLPDRQGYVKQALAAAKELLNGVYPSVDFALLLVERGLSLPARAGAYLFYLGRLVGWVAHVMEQYSQGQPINPLARYVGHSPQD
jgi:citrate synthase